jgi:PAB1-binding protein PBP1
MSTYLKNHIRTSKTLLSILKLTFRFKAESEDLYFGNLDDDMANWNQFEANKQKFNVTTTYTEIQYTTELDYNKIPNQVKEKAEKIAKVIINLTKEILENDNVDNIHIKEERGLISQADGDEEEKYSSVFRK